MPQKGTQSSKDEAMKPNRKAKSEMPRAKGLKEKEAEELLKTLKARFEKNMNRHKGLEWAKVQAKLEAKQ